MPEKLRELLELANRVKMTPDEQEEQRVSFAYGNAALENLKMTREDVVRASGLLREKASEPTEPPDSVSR